MPLRLRSIAAIAATLWCAEAGAAPAFRTRRAERAVVVGGSISTFYGGNFGQFLQFGCKDLEVINRGEVGAGAAKIHQTVRDDLLADDGLLAGDGDHRWLIVQGGLNSVWMPEATSWWLSRTFAAAHAAGVKVVALSLTPWGSDDDPRFAGYKALRLHRATAHIVEFVMGRLTPQAALGARNARRSPPDRWSDAERPDVAVDLWNSDLREGDRAALRNRAPLAASFDRSPYRKRKEERDALVAAAAAVPRQYLARRYWSFDHTHPSSAGHRLMAALVCQQAPVAWGCDCDAIRRAVWRGKIAAGP